jgi:uncharacterized protein (TIGR00251 family)
MMTDINCTLSVRVIPNKPESKIVAIYEDTKIRIDIKSRPIDGKANQELIKYLAKLFGVNRNQVMIVRGINSRNKLIKIESVNNARISAILGWKRS